MSNTTTYPWYDIVESVTPLTQGDLLPKCPLYKPIAAQTDEEETAEPSLEASISAEEVTHDVVIMTQACDLEQRKVDLVLVCPFCSLEDFADKNSYFKGDKGKEALRRAYFPGNHLLNKCDKGDYQNKFLVVDFYQVFAVPLDFLESFASKICQRVRLLPPYREHLSQAFARFFMRIGLPLDIPQFHKKAKLPPS